MIYQFEKKEDEVVGYCPIDKIMEKYEMTVTQGATEKSFATIFKHLGIPIGLVLQHPKKEKYTDIEESFHSEIPDNLFDHLFEEVSISKKSENSNNLPKNSKTKKNRKHTKKSSV
jgi:hypothetical protein